MIKDLLLNWLGCGDYEDLKIQNQQLYQLAHFDNLTGLANRMSFHKEADETLAHCEAEIEPLTIFLIDLDNFKMINDTHGHLSGNLLLQNIAQRLMNIAEARSLLASRRFVNKALIDKRPRGGSLVARLGGDEFVMAFEYMDKHEADIVCRQINQELKETVIINNFEISVSASVGASIFPWDGKTIHDLLKAADLAMYAAKEGGKDRYAFYERSMNTKVERRVEAELVVREIIEHENIILFYQPIIDIETQQIVGAEALMRGKKLTEKFYDPMELIIVAEATNLIIPLGMIILKSACNFARRCIDIAGDCGAFISVNVSSFQLKDPDFVDRVEAILEETQLLPSHLVLEITETMLMENFEAASRALNELRRIGVRISIDDFGKGYSSFSYLHRLPIDKVKIDMSFIQSIGLDTKSNEIVKAIILMSDVLGMHTCAEGVETELQFNKLKEFGCEEAQGYFKYKALAEDEFLDLLQ